MSDKNLKILFSSIEETIAEEIKNHLEGSSYKYEFCIFSETESNVLTFKPDMLITEINSALPDFEMQLNQLKNLARSVDIPFAVIINYNVHDAYNYLISNSIINFITLPIHKNDFLSYLNTFLCIEDQDNNTGLNVPSSKYTCSESENSLISNLVIQNRMLKDQLIKIQPLQHMEHVHFEKVNEHRIVEQKLWEAYDNNYFKLYYQPVISIDTGKLAGFEALIRLIHPVDGLTPPDEFIHVAENSAIIFPLGLWIIEEACRQVASWKEQFLLDTHLKININLSAKQFIHPQLTSHIFEITERLGIDEHDIAFELTESAFMEDMESANIALLELRSKKFALYMDDFGTGYSSLSYLMHFPVNVIKIDQSFVKWMHIDEQSETLVRSLVALAHNLGLKVVAEGTDDESHIEILKSCGCDYAQGYLFSKPLPADDAEKFISKHFQKRK